MSDLYMDIRGNVYKIISEGVSRIAGKSYGDDLIIYCQITKPDMTLVTLADDFFAFVDKIPVGSLCSFTYKQDVYTSAKEQITEWK